MTDGKRALDTEPTQPKHDDKPRPGRSDYDMLSVVDTGNGPKFDGPLRDRVGASPHLLATMPPALGEYRHGGYLRVLDVEFRQTGWDGFVHVFERVRA